mmetsp:Transcript_33456/g.105403  ORF Transcript_33456/g.105403 Transcript_33456/m.105403 type:complete len:126 (+) Transcript_33456:1171-1548(+)
MIRCSYAQWSWNNVYHVYSPRGLNGSADHYCLIWVNSPTKFRPGEHFLKHLLYPRDSRRSPDQQNLVDVCSLNPTMHFMQRSINRVLEFGKHRLCYLLEFLSRQTRLKVDPVEHVIYAHVTLHDS